MNCINRLGSKRPKRGSRRFEARICILFIGLVLASTACQRAQPLKATAAQLEKSFKKDASVTADVAQASKALQNSNYTQAMLIMNHVSRGRSLDEAQKKAVDALILQTRQAIEKNPKLNDAQLYKAMSDLMVQVHGEN